MRIVAARLREIAWTLDGRGAAAGRTERRGIVLEVDTDAGITGRGEASPLPGMSRDTLDDARSVLEGFVSQVPFEAIDPAVIFDIARPTISPSARFAIETALLDAFAQTRGTTIAQLLDAAAPPSVATNVVVDTADDARRAVAGGVRVLKVKVPGDDLTRVEAIAAAAPGAALRLDANCAWPRATVHARLAELEAIARRTGVTIEYVEEPCRDAYDLLVGGAPPRTRTHAGTYRSRLDEPSIDDTLPLALALDESLATMTDEQIDRALRSPSLGALVLKPTLLGGFAACLALADRARAAGVAAIVTHTLESPVGATACFEIARIVGGDRARGVSGLTNAHNEVSAEASSNAAHVRAAADAHAGTTSTGSNRREGELARSTATAVLVASPTTETIDRIREALDTRRPIALLHPALPEAELARQRTAVETATLDPGDVVLFTSGSTGTARGVVVSRRAMKAAVEASAAHLGWRDDDRWLLALSTAHAGGAAVVARCHFAGKPIELLAEWDRAAAVAALEKSTLASLVPTQLAQLLDDPAWRPPARLRAVLLGGAAASPALLAKAAARRVPFLTTYGMTESFGQLATAPLDRAGDPNAPLVPLQNVELVGGTREVPAPIRVRAPMLATRYLDGTPIAPEHVTSDLGFVDGGLHVVGRTDDMIITGGENVSPATIEAVLAATPGVRAACAFAIPDPTWGQIVGAAIAAEHLDATAIASWQAALPAHARPRELAVVPALPMLATGKLDRRAAARLPRERVRY